MFRIVIGLTLASALLTSGCAEFQELSIAQRNHKAASGAWKQARWDYWQQGVPHKLREHVGRGFEQGYYDVASGGSGAIPLFPPSYYWGTRYQTPEGTAYIGAWFRGYQDGAMAAERDGLASYNQIPTSWAPAMQGSAANPAEASIPGLSPDFPPAEGEVVPPIPSADTGPIVPMVPVQPQTELPVLPETNLQPLVVPAQPPVVVPPVVPASPAPGAAATPGAAVPKADVKIVPAPAAPAAPTTPPPRDPVGGKQTLLLPEAARPPFAQAALFGESVELIP